MQLINYLTVAAFVTTASVAAGAAAAALKPGDTQYWQSADSRAQEAYLEEEVPPGVQVVWNSLEGPVYADDEGRTLYTWPLIALRNGSVGDRKDAPSNCTDEVLRYEDGLMSPYPAGLVLPYADQGISCAQVWPPMLAADGAEEVGKWSVIQRQDGANQWAYDGYPVYTSSLDQKPGDALGGTKISSGGDGGVVRVPLGPAPDIPPGFHVISSSTGRLLVNNNEYSVYVWSGDEPGVSNCRDECLKDWTPVRAPAVAAERDEWKVIKHPSGINQWAFRDQPLYTYNKDHQRRSFDGADVQGWQNVYTQRSVSPPEGFTVQDADFGGQVLADANGKSIYLYNCHDDSAAQLACDHPDAAQEYRMAICGAGDPELCLKTFPYVEAKPDAKGANALWSVMAIDPNTGRRAAAGQESALNVWAYRGRPVYTYGHDDRPGVTNGDAFGEFTGHRNGYKAFVLRDVFQRNAFRR